MQNETARIEAFSDGVFAIAITLLVLEFGGRGKNWGDQLYFELGRINEAMPEFQKAQGNPHKRVQAMSYMGQCLARKGFNDIAASTLREALKEKVVFDEEKKDLIYALGSVLEKMGKTEEAIEHYKEIYQVDMGFKDVAAKVDAYYQSKAGQA